MARNPGRHALVDRNRVIRVNAHFRLDAEPAAANDQRAFRAAEGEPRITLAASGLADGKGYVELRVFEQGVLRVRSFAVVLQRPAAAGGGDGLRSLRIKHPLHDIEVVGAKIRHLPAGIVPEPAEM